MSSLLVLGGTSDIAVATARALVERGTRSVVLAGRDPDRLAAVGAELDADVETARLDALETSSHERLIEELFERHGPFDVVLLAIGVLEGAPPLRVIETNLVGTASLALAVAPRLRAQARGVLVVLSSTAAERAPRAEYVYAASKAGLDRIAEGLGHELEGSGARVMVVRPGFVRTKMTAQRPPRPWATTPDAVASAIVHGLEREVTTVWAPPALRWVMAIVRHLPSGVYEWANRRY